MVAASRDATEKYGAGAGASRLITGNNPLYADLETALASIKGTEDAVVFGSGYLTNIGVIPALAARPDLILMDELCHACLNAGATLARCRTIRYSHLDTSELASLLNDTPAGASPLPGAHRRRIQHGWRPCAGGGRFWKLCEGRTTRG